MSKTERKTNNMAKSKQEQWQDACSEAEAAVQKLLDLQADCQEKYDAMSEKQLEGDKAEALSSICDLDLQGAMDTIQEAAGLNLP